MKEIPLSKGCSAQVDDEDYEWLSEFTWHTLKAGNDLLYACRKEVKPDGTRTTQLMHRLIMGVDQSLDVDHCDNDGLNNQRINLRPATRSQNNANARTRSDNKSGHRGVAWRAGIGKWEARIQWKYVVTLLGYFIDKNDAITARKEAEKSFFGEFRRK